METVLFVGAINFVMAYVLWFYFFRTYFIDSHRHELFNLRNRLFNYAFENNISFENSAFKDRWNEINGMIQLAHISHSMFIASLFLDKERSKKDFYLRVRAENMKHLEERHQKFIEANRKEQFDQFFSYLIKSSLVFLVLSLFFAIIFFVIAYIYFINNRNKFRKQIRDHVEPIYENYTFAALKNA